MAEGLSPAEVAPKRPPFLCAWGPTKGTLTKLPVFLPGGQDNFGYDLAAVEAAKKKHEAIETDTAAYEERVRALRQIQDLPRPQPLPHCPGGG